MKRALPLALILYHSISVAEPIAVTPNVTGGYTILTNEDCKANMEHLQAYATNEKGDVTKACWYIKDDYVYFTPKSGILRRLPLEQFEVIVPKPKPKSKVYSRVSLLSV